MFTTKEVQDILRIDSCDNDSEIEALVMALPEYLYHVTGYRASGGNYSPVALIAGRFILWQWYYGENADTDKLQRVIDSLLKALSAERTQP